MMSFQHPSYRWRKFFGLPFEGLGFTTLKLVFSMDVFFLIDITQVSSLHSLTEEWVSCNNMWHPSQCSWTWQLWIKMFFLLWAQKKSVVVKTYLNSTRLFPLFTLRSQVQIIYFFIFPIFFYLQFYFFLLGCSSTICIECMRARNYTMFKFFQVKVEPYVKLFKAWQN
jgi:hypothetical protein